MDKRYILLVVFGVFVGGIVLAFVNSTHDIQVEKYKGKLTNDQVNQLITAYEEDRKYSVVTVDCTNENHHRITVEYMNGYCPQDNNTYERGFYASVWDTDLGIDGVKVVNEKISIE